MATKIERLEAKAKTLHAKIAADTEQYNGLVEQLRHLHRVRNAQPGDRVSFEIGRGKTRRTGRGEVVGIKSDDTGRVSLRVLEGTGFDAVTVSVVEHEVINITSDEVPSNGEEQQH